LQKLFYLIANGMAAFMDFGLGCLIAVVTAIYFNHPLMWWEPLAAGAVFSILPDYDIVPFILRRAATGKSFHFDHHQTILHWPIVVLPIVTAVMWYFFGEYWGNVAFVCIFAHYVHDAVFMENGIAWIVRLKRTFKGDTGHIDPDRWIAINWLRPSGLSFIELLIGTACASIAFIEVSENGNLGMLLFVGLWISTFAFWKLAQKFEYA
jgi:hypothetical protein